MPPLTPARATTILVVSEPEPDLLAVSGSWQDYTEYHPIASDACLVIEASDVALAKDRGLKAGLYAASNIADYWIINLVDRQLEVYRDPAALPIGIGYKLRQVLVPGDSVSPLFAPDSILAVADLLLSA